MFADQFSHIIKFGERFLYLAVEWKFIVGENWLEIKLWLLLRSMLLTANKASLLTGVEASPFIGSLIELF